MTDDGNVRFAFPAGRLPVTVESPLGAMLGAEIEEAA